MRTYAQGFRLRTGRSLSRAMRRKTAERYWISDRDRFAIYERDGWICQLCFEPVDRAAPPNSQMDATLDHIEPQSFALFPDHSPENLRLAHRACNSRRRDRLEVS